MGRGDRHHQHAGGERFLQRIVASPVPKVESCEWWDGDGFARADPPQAVVSFASATLRASGFALWGRTELVRHRPGDHGLPFQADSAPFSFTIDFSTSPRVLDGGLLLFVEERGRVKGWRAQAGALVIWDGAQPELTELAPGSPGRLTLMGGALRSAN